MTKLSGPMLAPRSGKPPRQIVVLLHGYGADGEDLIDLGRLWGEAMPDALFVSPNAPNRCAGNPFGYEWFPLQVDRIAGRIEGAREAAPVIRAFLDDLWAQTGLSAADTFLVGFSQGAMMALHVGTASESPFKGIVAFSGALVPAADFGAAEHARPPVVLIHGDVDQVVDPQLSRDAETALKSAGFEASLHLLAGLGHGISPEGLALATDFMRGR
jgi:phospholipase/carboxylesterase